MYADIDSFTRVHRAAGLAHHRRHQPCQNAQCHAGDAREIADTGRHLYQRRAEPVR